MASDYVSTFQAAQVIVQECGSCDSKEGVESFCLPCQVVLCRICKDYHEKSKLTRTHTIVPLEESRHHDVIVTQSCELHAGKELELYCKTCKTPVCTQCILIHHKGHDLSSITDVKQTSIKNIKQESKRLDSIELQKRKELAVTYGSELRLKESADIAKRKCDEHVGKFIDAINKCRDEIHLKIDHLEGTERKRIKLAKDTIEKDIERVGRLKTDSKFHLDTKPNTCMIFNKDLASAVAMLSLDFECSSFHTIEFVQSDLNVLRPKTIIGSVHYKTNTNDNRDVSVCAIKTTTAFPTKPASKIRAICPMIDGTAILIHYDSKDLTFMDGNGIEINMLTVRTFIPYDVACYENFLYVTSGDGPLVMKMHLSSGHLELFYQFETFNASGIAISEDNYIFICLKAIHRYKKFGKIVKMTPEAVVVQEFSINQEGFPLFTKPRRITCLGGGCFAVIDVNSVESKVLVLDSSGTLLGTWNGKDTPEINGKLDLCGVAIFKERQIMLVTDWKTNHIYCLEIDPQRKNIATKYTFKIQRPYSVAVNTTGNVFVGCGDGYVHNLMIS